MHRDVHVRDVHVRGVLPPPVREDGMGPDGFPQDLVTDDNLDDLHRLSRRIGDAMSARAIVEQAKGVIMGARRCGPDEAFDALRRSAHLEKMRVQDFARRVLDAVAAPDGV
jgi:hypothetical protein